MDKYDDETTYCRMLGHAIPFKYCRLTAEGVPCRKIMDCWFEKFPVETYMKEHFSDDELKHLLTPPNSKVSSLLDLIEKAKQRKKD